VAEPTLERPKRAEFGDYSTNAALLLARASARRHASWPSASAAALSERLGADLDRYDVAGPGFLNLFLSDTWCRRALAAALAAGPRFGGGGRRAPNGSGRVRLGQPDRPDARRPRA